MFFEPCCILCLEKYNKVDNSIAIDSNDLYSASARQTIEHYFKEVLVMMSYIPTKVVCNPCWKLVKSFHDFYIKIKNSHLVANIKLKSLQETEISDTEEEKIEVGAIDKLAYVDVETATNEALDARRLTQSSVEETVSPNQSFGSDDNWENLREICPSSEKEGMDVKEETGRKSGSKLKNKTRHKTSAYDKFIAKNFELTCDRCKKSINDFKDLKIHYKKIHQTNGYVKCCGKKLFNRGVLVDHIHTHNNPEYFKCKQCGKVLCDRSGLETHLKNFHDPKQRTIYFCNICSKSFYRQKVLARHHLIHSSEDEKNVKCTQCDKRFCNQYSMKQHLALVHLNLYAKICDICGKAFNGNGAFQRHLEEHAGVSTPLIKCQLCSTEHKTKYLLTRHIKTMHTEEYQTPQVCPICSKVSPTLRAHKSHIEYMHTEKKHICKLCDKAFKLPRCLREHMTTHTGDVLYTCTFCPQTFNSHSNMYAHRKRKHPNEWAEKCAKRTASTGIRQLVKKDLISKVKPADLEYAK